MNYILYLHLVGISNLLSELMNYKVPCKKAKDGPYCVCIFMNLLGDINVNEVIID